METVDVMPVEYHGAVVARDPDDTLMYASRLATKISDVIERQKLYVNIQGKKYVKCDAWIALGFLDGVIPRERSVTELADGSYEAFVELIRNDNSRVIGGASALCGIDESRWKRAERYARRSMAVTRATGKAFRLQYSWIMCLAGYEPTPAEEIPDRQDAPAEEMQKRQEEPKPTYDDTPEQREALIAYLSKNEVPEELHDGIIHAMKGRLKSDIHIVMKDLQ